MYLQITIISLKKFWCMARDLSYKWKVGGSEENAVVSIFLLTSEASCPALLTSTPNSFPPGFSFVSTPPGAPQSCGHINTVRAKGLRVDHLFTYSLKPTPGQNPEVHIKELLFSPLLPAGSCCKHWGTWWPPSLDLKLVWSQELCFVHLCICPPSYLAQHWVNIL